VKRFLVLLALTCPAFAGEYAVLRNGFRIHAQTHESVGSTTRLHTATGSVDVPSADIARFEIEEYVALAAPAEEPVVPAAATAPPTPRELIEQAAVKHGLRPEFVASVALAESAYRTDAISPKGAVGLMQLMPGTAQELGVDPRDPAQNAEAGARYLKQLLLRYAGSPDPVRLALAAYSAGPAAVDKYRNIPPYRETQQYVERVLRRYLADLKASGQIHDTT
jgi:soluble lytic murein transglycosylase-like protein